MTPRDLAAAGLAAWCLTSCRGESDPAEASGATPGEVPCDEVDWDNFASPFLQTWCTPCHSAQLSGEQRSGAPEGVDFDTPSLAAEFAVRIVAAATGEAPTMPPGGGTSLAEQELLTRWATCGAVGEEEPAGPCDAVTVRAGDLVVGSAEDAEAFCATHDSVGGDLIVVAEGEIGVDCLCEVRGDLSVEFAPTEAVALPSLRSVGGAVRVADNDALERLSAPLLTGALGGELLVARNPSLASLELFELDAVGDLTLEDLPSLSTSGLTDLDDVGGAVLLRRTGMVLVDLVRLDGVGGDLRVEENAGLVSLAPMDALGSVGGSVRISNNPDLEVIPGFFDLEVIGGDVQIEANPAMVGFGGLWSLTEVGGSVTLAGNDGLVMISGFESLVRIGGDLRIAQSGELLAITGFPVLSEVGGAVVVEELGALVSLEGSLPLVSAGSVRVAGTGILVLEQFDALEQVGAVSIVGNPRLTTMRVGDALVGATGPLTIEGNPVLGLVGGFSQLSSVAGLAVVDNASLTSLAAFDALQWVVGDLTIVDNTALPTSQATLLEASVVVEGTVTIAGNAAE